MEMRGPGFGVRIFHRKYRFDASSAIPSSLRSRSHGRETLSAQPEVPSLSDMKKLRLGIVRHHAVIHVTEIQKGAHGDQRNALDHISG